MNHKRKRHRAMKRIKKRFKNIAAAVAGTAILSGAMLPGIPAAVVHASPDPNAANTPPVTTSQQVENPDQAANPAQAPTEFKQVLDIKATAYAPGAHDNDQWGSKTFLGTQVRPGIVAVDPKVIPLGSRLYIQYPDGHGEYVVAEDTGGAIKGNRIDVAMSSVPKAEKFGVQQVKVFVVSTPEKA